MKPTVRRLLLAAGPACVLSLCGPAFAANPCDALYNASIKAVQTPHHVYTTTTGGRSEKPQSSEAIFAGGVEYLQIHGQWRRSAMPQRYMVAAAQERLRTHPDTCTLDGDETVDGQAVTTYKVHSNADGTDSRVHILKSTGLLLGQTLTRPDGSVVKTRYDYTNVQPPAGVH